MGQKGSIIEKTAGKWRKNPVESNQTCFRRGVRDGMPIALGYFAVAFTLGIR